MTLVVVATLALVQPAGAAGELPAVQFVDVGNMPGGEPLAPSFLGLSLEYQALHAYTGRDPAAINPVLVQLIRNLNPGQSPVLRIGGRSTDSTWWPLPGVFPGGGVRHGLNQGWMATTRALAGQLGARFIFGVNLESRSPAVAAAEARALLQRVGRSYIQALELGNEPDTYPHLAWYHDALGRANFSRRSSYSIGDFTREFSRWRAALPPLPIAGPAFANLTWMRHLAPFLFAEPGLGLVTFHRYPLRGCRVTRDSPSYPTIERLLSDYSTSELAEGVAQFVQLAHSYDLQFRVDEMNSVACAGRRGVSDTFASALWMLDTLFGMAAVGVDGVNVHTLPGAEYELFTFKHSHGTWRAFVRPEYYGMLLFARAAPPGSQLLPVTGASSQLRVWATLAPDGTRHIVLINKDLTDTHQVFVRPPGAATAARVQWLMAPSVDATRDVSLGGQSFGNATDTGTLPGAARDDVATPVAGDYSITLPPASAVMLTPS